MFTSMAFCWPLGKSVNFCCRLIRNLATYKRSAMDLAMMQVYRICDKDKNGLFIGKELQCVQRVLQILFTGR
ncbi:hypothetical protein Btru_010091 [Bulinus truncatus]|nr:hypothetical protein Btru_010091 [Bulinus truncatus]